MGKYRTCENSLSGKMRGKLKTGEISTYLNNWQRKERNGIQHKAEDRAVHSSQSGERHAWNNGFKNRRVVTEGRQPAQDTHIRIQKLGST
jgi:hypothetical protein